MKKVYLIILTCLLFGVNAQIINIPDANFKAKLLSANSTNNIALNSADQSIMIDTNGDNEIQVSEALNVYQLSIYSGMITDLTGINQFGNLVTLSVSGNSLTNLQITGLSHLQLINVGYNQLTSLSVSNLNSLQTLSCSNNLLTSIDISGLQNLITLECSNNLISSLTLDNNNNLLNITAANNKLTSVDFNAAPKLSNLYINNNLFNTIDVGQLTQLGNFNFSNNPNLTSFNIKNGKHNYAQGATPYFSNTPNLHYICADDFESLMIGLLLNYNNQPNVVINSYCSFTSGGNSYIIRGDIRYDADNNGCDINDQIVPLQKFSINSGYFLGNMFGNAIGNYAISLQAGIYNITPVVENSSYFTVSPLNVTVNFPTQTSPVSQNFCLSANGMHPDLETLIFPLTPAIPGFDAKYKITYKNKGTHAQSGTLSFIYNDNLTDYLTATVNPNSTSL